MQLNKFKILGAAAIIVAAGLNLNVAHAQSSYGSSVDQEPAKVQQVEQKNIFQTLRDVLSNKTEQRSNDTITAETKELLDRPALEEPKKQTYGPEKNQTQYNKYGTVSSKENIKSKNNNSSRDKFENVGKYGAKKVDDRMSNEDILIASTKNYKPEKPTNKANKYGSVSNIDERMSNEDILIASTKNYKPEQTVNKGDVLLKQNEKTQSPTIASEPTPEVNPRDILLKAWQGTKNVASTVAERGKDSIMSAKAKIDAENQKKREEAQIVKAEVPMPGNITKDDVIKTKDKILDGMSGFLNKLRSEPKSENDNKNKPS